MQLRNRLKELSDHLSNLWRTSPAIKNISKVYVGTILSKVFTFGALLLLIRGLSVKDYASYTAFYTICNLLPGLLGAGINTALVRFSAEYLSRENRKPLELYFVVLVFDIVLFILFSIFLLLVSDKANILLFGNLKYKTAFQYGLLAGLGLFLTNAGQSIYRAEEDFWLYVKSLWLQYIPTFLLIAALFFLEKLNFSNVFKVITAANFGVAIIVNGIIFRHFSIRQTIKFVYQEFDLIKEFFSSTKWLIAYFFIMSLFGRLDIFMLSHFSVEEELAKYGVAFRYYSMSLLLLGAIHAVLLPKFSKLGMQDVEKQRAFTYRWLRATVWLAVPFAIADIVGKPLFIWINGIQYERSFYIFIVFTIGIWFSLMFSPIVNILVSRKEFKFLLLLSAIAFVLNFTGNYLLIPMWGGFGAALMTVSSMALINATACVKVISSRKSSESAG